MEECYSCPSLSGEKRISPGPIVYDGRYWVVDHAYPTTHTGWLVIVLKRHAEALHELGREEFAELAEIQYRLAQALQRDNNTLKEYTACFGEAAHFSHIHVHFVQRPIDLPAEMRGPRIFARLNVDQEQAISAEAVIAYCERLKQTLATIS